ncbi:hypothetical protein ABIE50_004244 [Chitinophaga sp. OAE865]
MIVLLNSCPSPLALEMYWSESMPGFAACKNYDCIVNGI